MLRKLVLHGFKSFCDRTEIHLGSGITAIVGPNGCGKSNLADALRWVLGEQNPRVLRCEKLQDIIFSGTERRRAMGMAEVRLLLDSEGFPEETEVVRRLTRDGSSEYRMNGRVCRWKDVVEAFAGTGLSYLGYVVIGQGTIHELVSGKPQERRIWIEEASGVSRIRFDKKDTEAHLESATRDLARLSDLLVELSARQATLRRDSELSAKYRELAGKKREVELGIWLHQEAEESRKVASLLKRIEKLESDLKAVGETLPLAQEEIAKLQKSKATVDQAISGYENELQSLAVQVLDLEKRRDEARTRVALLKKELESRGARKRAIEEDLQKLQAELLEIENTWRESAREYSSVKEEYEKALEIRSQSEVAWKELSEKVLAVRAETVALTQELGTCQKARDEIARKLEGVRRQIAAIEAWVRSSREQIARLVEEASRFDAEQELWSAKAQELRASVVSLEARQRELRGQVAALSTREREASSRLSALVGRKKVLEDLEKAFEGYGKGPRTVLEARDKGVLDGVEGSIGELLACDEQYIPALSAALGGSAEYIVVRDDSAARKAIEYLKQHRGGRATFLPLNLIRPRGLDARTASLVRTFGGVRPLIDVVSFPDKVRPAAIYLLGRVVLADNIDVGLAFMKESSWATRVVTLGGETIEPGGAMTGGEAPRAEVFLRRRQELQRIERSMQEVMRELESASSARREAEKSLQSVASLIEKSRDEWTRAEAHVSRIQEQKRRTQASLDALKQEMEKQSSALDALAREDAAYSREIEVLALKEKDISGRMLAREQELRGYEQSLQEIFQRDHGFSERQRTLAEQKEMLERKMSALQRRQDALTGEKVSLERNMEDEAREIDRLTVLLKDARYSEETLTAQIAQVDARMSRLKEALREARDRSGEIDRELSARREQVDGLLREKTMISQKLEDARKDLDICTNALSEVRQYLLTQFGIDQPSACPARRVSRAEGLAEMDLLEREMAELGPVNLKAEEELAQLSDRISKLLEEKEDIEAAIEELHRTRELIEREIERRFRETFCMVAQNFSDIFKELFGGGLASLELTDLGVEVLAQPPGRRTKHLNLLSGGERSLCGIALILAILSVKPSPFIVLDEVDTSLDEANMVRFASFLKKYAQKTQFLVITHQEATMEAADILYGVTMDEPGVSRVFSMRLSSQSGS